MAFWKKTNLSYGKSFVYIKELIHNTLQNFFLSRTGTIGQGGDNFYTVDPLSMIYLGFKF